MLAIIDEMGLDQKQKCRGGGGGDLQFTKVVVGGGMQRQEVVAGGGLKVAVGVLPAFLDRNDEWRGRE